MKNKVCCVLFSYSVFVCIVSSADTYITWWTISRHAWMLSACSLFKYHFHFEVDCNLYLEKWLWSANEKICTHTERKRAIANVAFRLVEATEKKKQRETRNILEKMDENVNEIERNDNNKKHRNNGKLSWWTTQKREKTKEKQQKKHK